MSSVVISGDTSGSVSLTVPSIAGSNTVTLPASTGTVMVSGNMPAFSAYKSGGDGDQTISANTWTKITFPTEQFDTNNNFASSTFTPTVAGYYQISSNCDSGVAAAGLRAQIAIYKNGSIWKNGAGPVSGFVANEFDCFVSALVYLNGSTDYVEIYSFMSGTTPKVYGSSSGNESYIQGVLVRSA